MQASSLDSLVKEPLSCSLCPYPSFAFSPRLPIGSVPVSPTAAQDHAPSPSSQGAASGNSVRGFLLVLLHDSPLCGDDQRLPTSSPHHRMARRCISKEPTIQDTAHNIFLIYEDVSGHQFSQEKKKYFLKIMLRGQQTTDWGGGPRAAQRENQGSATSRSRPQPQPWLCSLGRTG